MVNFYDMIKSVCTLAHEDFPSSFDDISRPYPEIRQYIQDTVEEVCSKFPWTFRERKYTLTTTAAKREYDLPDGLEPQNILQDGVRIEEYNPSLYFLNHNHLDKLILSSGKPYRYSVYASKFILDPTPDNTYTIEIKYLTTNYALDNPTEGEPTEKSNLEDDTDTTIIPDRFIKVIEWGAFSLYRQNFKPDNKYNLARSKFMEYLLDMQKQDGYGQDASSSITISHELDLNSIMMRDFFDPRC